MSLPGAAVRLLEEIDPNAIRLGLEAPRRLLRQLGDPQKSYATVLVAGTNGKGSTAAWLAAMAVAAGYRTGLYTSPHLEDLTERVRVDGRAVSGAELGDALLSVGAAAEEALGGLPTYFELVTAAALRGFAAAAVDLAILEVGMGGRLDATNVVEPELSIITEVGLDHERHLGASRAEIAAEKAGILRPGKQAIVGCSHPEAMAAVRRAAMSVGAELVDGTAAAGRRLEGRRQILELTTRRGVYRLRQSLPGKHQAANLTLAVLAAERLRELGWPAIDEAAIAAGAERCRWPGRLETVTVPGRQLLLDVAHNPDAAAALVAHLDRLGRPYDLLYGTLADKRSEHILPSLAASARRIVLTRPAGARSRDPRELVPLLTGRKAIVEPRPGPALDRALVGAAPLLVVCGSFYLVGEVRGMLSRRFGVPEPAAKVRTC